MRNPNGYGSVYKLSGNRRNPYAARITVGFKKTEKSAQPIYKFLGFYKTQKEAAIALALYNENPEAVVTVNNTLTPTNKITLFKVYEEWSAEHFQTIKNPGIYKSPFKVLQPLYERPITSLKINDYEDVFEKSGKNKPILTLAKSCLKQMYQFAFRKGYVDEASVNIPTYISFVNAKSGKKENFRKRFTFEEIDSLWEKKDEQGVQIVLFMIYTGLRISEVALLKAEDIHLEERYFDVKMSKTEAGIRKVPIHEKIVPIIKEWFTITNTENDFFVPMKGNTRAVRIQAEWNGFYDTMKSLGLDHTQHDTRHTLSCLLTEAEVDFRFVELIMGHKLQDVTNKVYANKIDISVLVNAINTI